MDTLIGTLVVSPSLGVCRVLDFDKGGKFFLKCHTGGAGWRYKEEFDRLAIGDAVMYRDRMGALVLGLVTEIDNDTWEIGVIGEDGQTGYPYPDNVRCIVGRNMIVRQEDQAGLNIGLLRIITRSIASFVGKAQS